MTKYSLEAELMLCSDNLITFEAFINNAHQNGFTFSIVPNKSTGNIKLIATDQNKKVDKNETKLTELEFIPLLKVLNDYKNAWINSRLSDFMYSLRREESEQGRVCVGILKEFMRLENNLFRLIELEKLYQKNNGGKNE